MRNLATIQTITDIQPIEGKDLIGLATVLGWQVIVAKKDFSVGDKAIYVEIDSKLPEKPEFEFLRKKNFLIKTMKMAGVISQGICFPLSILPAGNYGVGQDVSDIMSVTKYDPEADVELTLKHREGKSNYKGILKWMMRFAWFRKIFLYNHKQQKDAFPSWIVKTDETRLQSIPNVLRNKEQFIITEKVDGCSVTFALKREKHPIFFWKQSFDFVVCSRNLRLPKDTSHYWKIAEDLNICGALKDLIKDQNYVILQGEIIGSKIQGNKYKLPDGTLDFYAFNLIYPDSKINSILAADILRDHGIKFVPILTQMPLKESVQEMVDYANGKSLLYDTLREGIVCRNYSKNMSFKVISPEFLLKHNL